MMMDRSGAWQRVDRTLEDLRRNVSAGTAEEHFQNVGLLGREVIISVAQAVFDSQRHKRNDGKDISTTDASGMLEAFFESELAGASKEEARRFAKSALALAVALGHHFSEGKLQVFETDRRTWRREVIAADRNAVLLIQRPQ